MVFNEFMTKQIAFEYLSYKKGDCQGQGQKSYLQIYHDTIWISIRHTDSTRTSCILVSILVQYGVHAMG